MAELIGVIAGGIAIEQLALSLFKLKEICSTVKKAPEEIVYLLGELKTITDLFAAIDAQHKQTNRETCPPAIWTECMFSCTNAAEALEAVIKKIGLLTGKKKILGGLNLALKMPTFLDLRSRLYTARDSLQLSHQVYMSARLENQIGIQHSQLQELLYAVSVLRAQLPPPSTQSVTQATFFTVQEVAAEALPTTENSHDDVTTVASRRRRGYPARVVTKIRCQLPAWLSRTAWELQFTKSRSPGWTLLPGVHVTPYIVVPYNSPAFEYAKTGNVHGLCALFDAGQASPFDVNAERSRSLLCVAAVCTNIEACQLLLERGADINYQDLNDNDIGLLRLWVGHEEAGDIFDTSSLLKIAIFLPGDLRILRLVEQYTCLAFKAIPLESRLLLASSYLNGSLDPECLHLRLGTSEFSVSTFKAYTDESADEFDQVDLFCIIAHRLGEILSSIHYGKVEHKATAYYGKVEHKVTAYLDGWRGMLKKAKGCKAHLHSLDRELSGLNAFFAGWFRISVKQPSENLYNHVLRTWLGELEAAEFDLLEYGTYEKQSLAQRICGKLHRNSDIILVSERWCPVISRAYSILNLTIGSSLQDWYIWVSELDFGIATQFWEFVESPESYLPGAWPQYELYNTAEE